VAFREQRLDEKYRRRDADDRADPQREITGLRTVLCPARAKTVVVDDHHRADREKEERHHDVRRALLHAART